MKRSRSKKGRRSNKARRRRIPAPERVQTHSETQAPHSQIQPVLPNAPAVTETTDVVDSLAATAAEHTFFAQACDFPVTELENNEMNPVLLRPEQLERRVWLRRQVTRLMAGLGTFSVIATAIQIASNV